MRSPKAGRRRDVSVAGDQEAGPRGLGASILAQASSACLLGMHSALPHSALRSLGSPHLSSAQPPADSQVTGPTGRRQGESICNVDYSHEIFFKHTETRISAWRREHNDINNISYHLLNIHPLPSPVLRPFTGSSKSSHEETLLLFLQVRRLRLRKPLANGRSQTWAWWSDSKAHPHRLCHHSEEE